MIDFHYFHPGCSMASHIALEESGLAYRPILTQVYDREARANYERINPKGTVPAIVVNGELLTENLAILTYVARMAPEAQLLPADPWAAAQCISFLAWCTSTVHIAFRQGFRPQRFAADEAALPAVRAAGRAGFLAALQTLDARVASQPYMLGENFSLADTYPMVFYNWGLVDDYPVSDLVHLTAYKNRMIARPAVRRVLEREGSIMLAA